jgi:hypothetical protein
MEKGVLEVAALADAAAGLENRVFDPMTGFIHFFDRI